MPQLTVKTEYVKKLKELGIYDQWLNNLKDQWGDGLLCRLNPDSDLYENSEYSWCWFIDYSFCWEYTKEGHMFWLDISHNY